MLLGMEIGRCRGNGIGGIEIFRWPRGQGSVFSVSIEQNKMGGMELYLPYSPGCGSSMIFLESVIKCPNYL
jgi:hypothetical protein